MAEQEVTTIRVSKDTRELLERLKIMEREPIEMVLKRILESYLESDEGAVKNEARKQIKRRIKTVNEGKSMSTADLRERIARLRKQEVRSGMGVRH
jgi:hypothetical protein